MQGVIQDAVEEELKKIEKGTLAGEYAKLDPNFERASSREESLNRLSLKFF